MVAVCGVGSAADSDSFSVRHIPALYRLTVEGPLLLYVRTPGTFFSYGTHEYILGKVRWNVVGG